MPVNPKRLSDRTGSPPSTSWTTRLKLTRLAQRTLPLGRPRVNLVERAKHVVPTAEYWRTGVQIPPAPPNDQKKTSTDVFFCACDLIHAAGFGMYERAKPANKAQNRDAPPKPNALAGVVSSLSICDAPLSQLSSQLKTVLCGISVLMQNLTPFQPAGFRKVFSGHRAVA